MEAAAHIKVLMVMYHVKGPDVGWDRNTAAITNGAESQRSQRRTSEAQQTENRK